MKDEIFDRLLRLLSRLDGLPQSLRFHPEGDALFHSLQVYERARAETEDPELRAAALLHDLGKGQPGDDHGLVGAELVGELVSERVAWLIEHHGDLMLAPKETRRRLAGDPRLADLTLLRRWDLQGRRPGAWVLSVDMVLGELLSPGVAERWLSPRATQEDER